MACASHPEQTLRTSFGYINSFRKLGICKVGGRYPVAAFDSCRIFARIPDRLQAPVLNMTDRKKAFAVLGLMSIRLAICLVVCPCIKRSRASADRKSTRLNSSHSQISYAVFCLKQ